MGQPVLSSGEAAARWQRSLARKWQGCAAHRFTKRSRYRTACCRGSHRTGIGTGQGSSRSKLATTVGDQVGVSQAAAATSDEVAQHCRRVAPHVGDALDSLSSLAKLALVIAE